VVDVEHDVAGERAAGAFPKVTADDNALLKNFSLIALRRSVACSWSAEPVSIWWPDTRISMSGGPPSGTRSHPPGADPEIQRAQSGESNDSRKPLCRARSSVARARVTP